MRRMAATTRRSGAQGPHVLHQLLGTAAAVAAAAVATPTRRTAVWGGPALWVYLTWRLPAVA
jgi:hypothetical protein